MLRALAATALFAGLSACVAMPEPRAPAAGETISLSVGPCFGFCPVYSVEVTPGGHVVFEGERHTGVEGRREAQAPDGGYAAVARALAPYRPATGASEQTTCERQATDMSHYTVVWTAADGTKTTLNHDGGCMSAKNAKLMEALKATPQRLGVEGWVRKPE
ncbi:DUF6438 domain-containing protein [Phenylobacterium sp.]|uniref:DUF6438 domain-containing protein n=1 Tax=Phenylobacterium sp. TaxID=1871053 RepID=UPI00198A5118|nr:DUF6438 domain-containing protein [Phenylobacterium sp.]MBC7166404.1 hypothetical protein [Phenylobacterium sp.]